MASLTCNHKQHKQCAETKARQSHCHDVDTSPVPLRQEQPRSSAGRRVLRKISTFRCIRHWCPGRIQPALVLFPIAVNTSTKMSVGGHRQRISTSELTTMDCKYSPKGLVFSGRPTTAMTPPGTNRLKYFDRSSMPDTVFRRTSKVIARAAMSSSLVLTRKSLAPNPSACSRLLSDRLIAVTVAPIFAAN